MTYQDWLIACEDKGGAKNDCQVSGTIIWLYSVRVDRGSDPRRRMGLEVGTLNYEIDCGHTDFELPVRWSSGDAEWAVGRTDQELEKLSGLERDISGGVLKKTSVWVGQQLCEPCNC